jgi:heme exporter protein C
MSAIYLWPLLDLAIAFTLLFATLLLLRMRAALMERKIETLRLMAAERVPA